MLDIFAGKCYHISNNVKIWQFERRVQYSVRKRGMKDFIVLIATIILGVIIAGLILSLRSAAQTIKDKAVEEINNVFSVEEVVRI